MVRLIKDLLLFIIIYLPGRSGIMLRNFVYRRKFKKYGDNVIIESGVTFIGHKNISIGNNVKIESNCLIETGNNLLGNIKYKFNYKPIHEINIGNNIHICRNSEIIGYGDLIIENNCVLSSGCKLYSLTNMPKDPDNPKKIISLMPYKDSVFLIGKVILKTNVWLGLNVIVMPDVTIGKDTFVTSNSIVTKSLDENLHAKGSPIEIIKKRFTE